MNNRKISRRRFLQLSAIATASTIAAACSPSAPAPEAEGPPAVEKEEVSIPASQYGEAPMLADLVRAGELPPVDERLPVVPMVLDLPWSDVGHYGGTLRKATTSSSFSDQTQLMYGHSSFHWTEGGQEVGPGLAKAWEVNEDATTWTLYYREGTRWSDGEPFTVNDVIFWWEDMILNEEHPTSRPSWTMSGDAPMQLLKVDDYTLTIQFAGPSPITDIEIAAWVGGGVGTGLDVQPRHYMEQFHPDYSDAEDFSTFTEKQNWWINPEHPVLNAWRPIRLEAGQRLVMERNPYYYMVDVADNQLPYIDTVDVGFAENNEILNLKIINGEIDFMAHPNLSLRDIAVYKDNEEEGNYRLELWDNGAGGAPAWGINWNFPEPEKQSVYRKVEFRRALSHGIDRERIRKLTFFGLGGPASTAVDSINSRQYYSSPRGKELLEQLLNLAVEHDPEKAGSLLDEAGVTDQNEDGWRQLPSGEPLEISIQINAGSPFTESAELMKEDWRAIGLDARVDAMPGAQLGQIFLGGTYDIRVFGGGAPGSADLLSFPVFLTSFGPSGRWAPLYGAWMSLEGTPREGVDADKPAHERQPPWDEPSPDDPAYRMWQLHKQARSEPDRQKRDELVYEILQIHVDEGPFWLGIIADLPRPAIIGNRVKNTPTRDQLPLGGWLGPWVVAYPGAITYPEQYYLDDMA